MLTEKDEGLRSGHISGSQNVHFRDLITEDCTLRDTKEIADVFYNAKLDPFLTSIVYSGRGISACILDLAMRSLGNDKTILYLGSWEQYVRSSNFKTFREENRSQTLTQAAGTPQLLR